jgi:hypothetical protein
MIPAQSGVESKRMTRKILASSLLALSLVALVIQGAVTPAHAQLTGTVCISDPLSITCPLSPIAVSALNGTQIQIAVNIQGSDPMNGFDIFVKADPSVLNPVGINLTNTVLGTNIFTVAECTGNTGFGCSSGQNGPGVVEVATVAFTSTTSPTTGRLFSIIYNVTSNAANVVIGFQTGCSGTSTAGNYCVTVVNGSTNTTDPEKLEESSGSPGDFSFFVEIPSATITRNSYVFGELHINSLAGFFGSMSLMLSISPVRENGPIVFLRSTGTVFLLPGTSTRMLFIFQTFRVTSPGTYTVTATGTSGSLSRSGSASIEVIVH